MADTRIVYGINCTWWDSIDNVALMPPGPEGHRIPCCPNCGSPLFEMDNERDWWAGVNKFEAAGHPGYSAMISWARWRCFPNWDVLGREYQRACR